MAINDIYGHNTKSNKSELYQDVIKNSATPASVFSETLSFFSHEAYSRDKTRHSFLRRLMNPAFSPKNLELSVNRYLDIFIHGIQQRAVHDGGVVEMNEWFHNLSFDVAPDSKTLNF
jgi:cytochrome P450